MTTPPQPAYLRAQRAILDMLAGPDHPPAARIPSERALAERFAISRMTVRHAVENLVRQGVLERDSTSGTRVARAGVVRNLAARATSLSQIIERTGAVPTSRLLRFEAARADHATAAALMLPRGARVIMLLRQRMADGTPFCLETSYLPAARVPGLAAADFLPSTSLYALLESRYGIHPARRRGRIQVATVGAEDADLLGLPAGASVLEYSAVVFDAAGRPLERVMSLNHPQRVVFITEDGAG